MLQIDHVLADEGGYIWTLKVFSEGQLALQRGLGRQSCRRLDIARLRQSLDELDSIPAGESFVPHGELIQVRYRGATEIYVREELPRSLRPVLEMVDTLFEQAYGRAYSWPLIREE